MRGTRRSLLAARGLTGPQTGVFYCEADPGISTLDGRTAAQGVDLTFANIRTRAGTAASVTETSSTSPSLSASTTSNQYAILRRAVWLFDTTSIPASATITGVTLSIYGTAKSTTLGAPDLVVDVPSPASNTTLANSDHNIANWAGTEKGRMTSASYSASGWNDISLNIDCITKGGITKLGGRLGWDFDNSTTGLTWTYPASSSFGWQCADNGSNGPKLTVNYTV